MRHWRILAGILALALLAGCSIIFANRSNVTTHDGDTQHGSNRATRIELKP